MAQSDNTMSHVIEKTAFCICENKGANQLHGNRTADQHLYSRYIDSTIPLLPKCKISSLQPSSVIVQPSLCQTWSENPEDLCSHNMDQIIIDNARALIHLQVMKAVSIFSKVQISNKICSC